MKYFDELKRAMTWLGEKPDTMFLGQAVEYKGTAMTNTLTEVNRDKLLEMPVNEDMQMGMTIGLALNGTIPISIYPRWNFLILAANQIVNHLDKFSSMSNGKLTPKVIIRVAVGSESPIDPQCQHKGNFTEAFKSLTQNLDIIQLDEPEDIIPAYEKALNREDGKSTILVEFADYCRTK